MPVTGRTSSTARARAARNESPRAKALTSLQSALVRAKKAGELPQAKLSFVDVHLYKGRSGERAVVVDVSDEDRAQVRGGTSFDRVLVDEQNKQFYADDATKGLVGPFPLPRGVTLQALFDDGTPFPRGKDDYERAVGRLARVVEKGLGEAYANGHVQLSYRGGAFRAPDGEKLAHFYIDDHTGRMPGGAVMIGKDRFWVELIPGISGDCIGPFALPRGFDVRALGGSGVGRWTTDADEIRSRSSGSSRSYASVLGDSGTYGRTSRWLSTSSGSWPSGGHTVRSWLLGSGGRGS